MQNAEWRKNWREKITVKSRSDWLLLKIWFLSKVGKSLTGKLQEEMEFRVSGLKNCQTLMNKLLFKWIRFWMKVNNWLIGWLMGERFYDKKKELKVTQWIIIDTSLVYHYCGSFWQALSLNICAREDIKEIAEEIKISYYWTKQCLETAKREVQSRCLE